MKFEYFLFFECLLSVCKYNSLNVKEMNKISLKKKVQLILN